jgi:protein gp37
MAEVTKIQWCDSSKALWIGCTKVSTEESGGGACDHCYAAESTPARTMRIVWGPGRQRHRTAESTWNELYRWDRQHTEFYAAHGRRRRVFPNQLSDTFDNEVPDSWRADFFRVMWKTPNLEYLVLTKRIGNALHMTREAGGWPPNAALGISVCNQKEADRDMPKAREVKRALRPLYLFASFEPLLGLIDFKTVLFNGFDQAIVGGESGRLAREFDLTWGRTVVSQARGAGVAPFVKQLGARPVLDGVPLQLNDPKGGDPEEWPSDLRIREFPNA